MKFFDCATHQLSKKLRLSLIIILICITSLFITSPRAMAATTAKPAFPKIQPDPQPLQILGPAGELFKFVKTGATTCGKYVIAEALIPPGTGPLPHVHTLTNEWFYTPDGGLTLEMGQKLYKTTSDIPGKTAPKEVLHLMSAEPGDIHYGAQYIMHGFMNQTKEPKRLTFIWAPDAGVTDYFKEVGQALPDYDNPPAIDPRSKEIFVTSAPKYGIMQSSSYFQYVENLVPENYDLPDVGGMHYDELVALLSNQDCPQKP